MHPKEVTRELETALTEARKNLVQSIGGESLCAIHKYGNPSDFLKYNEGKEFIVRKVIRLLNRDATEAEILSFLTANSDKFNRYKSSEATDSSAWQAYADGGLETIELIKGLLGIS